MKKEIEKMSFEEAFQELEDTVKKIDDGNDNLENSIAAFERGTKLKEHCEKKLQEAKMKIETITKSANGEIKAVESSFEN